MGLNVIIQDTLIGTTPDVNVAGETVLIRTALL